MEHTNGHWIDGYTVSKYSPGTQWLGKPWRDHNVYWTRQLWRMANFWLPNGRYCSVLTCELACGTSWAPVKYTSSVWWNVVGWRDVVFSKLWEDNSDSGHFTKRHLTPHSVNCQMDRTADWRRMNIVMESFESDSRRVLQDKLDIENKLWFSRHFHIGWVKKSKLSLV